MYHITTHQHWPNTQTAFINTPMQPVIHVCRPQAHCAVLICILFLWGVLSLDKKIKNVHRGKKTKQTNKIQQQQTTAKKWITKEWKPLKHWVYRWPVIPFSISVPIFLVLRLPLLCITNSGLFVTMRSQTVIMQPSVWRTLKHLCGLDPKAGFKGQPLAVVADP